MSDMARSIKDRLHPLPPLLARLESWLEMLPRQLCSVTCHPHQQLVKLDDEAWKATGEKPLFIVQGLDKPGWYYLEAAISRHSGNREAKLIVEMRDGSESTIPIPANLRGTVREMFYLPAGVKALYWLPMAAEGYFSQSELVVHHVSATEAWIRRAQRVLAWSYVFAGENEAARKLASPLARLRHLQTAYTLTARAQIDRYNSGTYADFLKRNAKKLHPPKAELQQALAGWKLIPTFSLIVVAEDDVPALQATLNSIQQQIYQNWEVYIVGQAKIIDLCVVQQAGNVTPVPISEGSEATEATEATEACNALIASLKGQWVTRIPAGG